MNPEATQTLLAGRVVTANAVHSPGWVSVSQNRITAVGAGSPPRGRDAVCGAGRDAGRNAVRGPTGGPTDDHTNDATNEPLKDLGDVTLVPGFVDLHSHGGGGGSYVGGDRDSALAAARAHRAHGTTSTMASLVAASPGDLLRDVAMLAELIADGASTVRGIHLEGPWLSPNRAGAHAVDLLRHPDPAEISELLEVGRGAIRMVTIAPELPGAIDAIHQLVEAGVAVAVGHTDASYDITRRAIEAGARVATHLFNAMRPLDHREPGPVLALIEDPRVSVELIADGVHVHPAIIDAVREAVGVDRMLLVTDAMAAAGHADGAYRLGDLDVEVQGGVARLAGSDTIAGSTTTMGATFRAAVRGARAVNDPAVRGARAVEDAVSRGQTEAVPGRADPEPSEDAALIAAVRQTAANPARVAGWDDLGDIVPGMRADFVVLDAELRVREVAPNLHTTEQNISTSR